MISATTSLQILFILFLPLSLSFSRKFNRLPFFPASLSPSAPLSTHPIRHVRSPNLKSLRIIQCCPS
ncbi:hypothetical protein K457DRAFT_1186004 [Linnemannia elongata AG-77]|uniref:Uncharacterized protein n=1 Tax=Linnemannia elongata AG-77 TaxID=1314771 RepID=A0A197K375_9FUNG|nr:hypothetical protein K457DRAFT_1186004 [Linnemannia elongata AG-77]